MWWWEGRYHPLVLLHWIIFRFQENHSWSLWNTEHFLSSSSASFPFYHWHTHSYSYTYSSFLSLYKHTCAYSPWECLLIFPYQWLLFEDQSSWQRSLIAMAWWLLKLENCSNAKLSRSDLRITTVAAAEAEWQPGMTHQAIEMISQSVGSLGWRAAIGVILHVYNQNKPRRVIGRWISLRLRTTL